jgi:hypothetical protein
VTELRFKACTFPNDHGGVCGWEVVYLDSGTKTHAPKLVCQRCDRMRKWLSHGQYDLIKTFQHEIARLMPHELPVLTDKTLTIGAKTVAFEIKENTGSIFKNTEKKSEKSPDYSGDGLLFGVPARIYGRIKEKKDGSKYLALSFVKKEEKEGADVPF